ncbi:membrane protein DedA with SNARE-associated domain [Bacillus oleivorans]|uniref:Membrane protein DedA with SNARE-associated domain n=1 Tax=Bacillus oleivorans TaxID=1448271 RepID=A0A285CMZ8_9BACI|nr:DedA family protein [Bacillus oleivorans]SNX68373.1 membrane protein DedA with SNARE-associated domain [Bacillus oleivorans]
MEWVHELFHLLQSFGFWGILLGLMVEVIPSEIVLGYGGYLVYSNHLSFLNAMIAGIIGGTIAQVFLYWVGLYGGRPFIERFGKWIFISPHHLSKSEKWFHQYGPTVIFFARFIPIVRHAISIPAGIGKMPFSAFLSYTIAAMIPWTLLFLLLGMSLGENWASLENMAGRYMKHLIIFAISSLLLYFLIKKRSLRKK